MTAGVRHLRRIQLGYETTAGTTAVTTTRYRGFGTIQDDLTLQQIDEDVGIIGGTDRTVIPKYGAKLTLPDEACSFEQLQYFIAMGFGGTTSGAADGSGSDKIYSTLIPTTAKITPVTYTLQGGDDVEVETFNYAVCTGFKLAGAGGAEVKISGEIIGRQVTTAAAFGTTATIPAIEDILTSKGKVWLDAVSGTFGGTQIAAGSILAFELDFKPIWEPKFTMEGNLYYTYPLFTGYDITGKLTYEHDTAVSGASGAKNFWRNQTPKLLRVDLIGNTVTTAGTAYSTKKAIFDLPIKFSKANAIGDQNGNDIVDMEFFSRYNLTAALAGRFIVVNELTALP